MSGIHKHGIIDIFGSSELGTHFAFAEQSIRSVDAVLAAIKQCINTWKFLI